MLAVFVLLTACGGGDGVASPAACGLAPCGGSVVGTWALSGGCIDQAALDTLLAAQTSELMTECPGGRIGNYRFDPRGTMTFNADGTYSSTLSATASIDMFVPKACIASGSCADFEAALRARVIADPDSPYETVSCTDGSTCRCTLASGTSSPAEQGTYTTSGSTLTTATATGTSGSLEYCVRGTSLMLHVPTDDFIYGMAAEKQ